MAARQKQSEAHWMCGRRNAFYVRRTDKQSACNCLPTVLTIRDLNRWPEKLCHKENSKKFVTNDGVVGFNQTKQQRGTGSEETHIIPGNVAVPERGIGSRRCGRGATAVDAAAGD
jgi:hypothetical protein